MAINFPSSPADGQVFNVSPGVSFVARGGLWKPAPLKTALPKNYVVNPAMQVSQENGDAVSAVAASLTYWPADQWIVNSSINSPGTLSSQRSRPALGGTDAIFLNVTAVQAAPNAGAYVQALQQIEGQRMAEFQWGTVKAQQAVFRFDFYANIAGTYTANIRTPASEKSFLWPITVATNTWTTFSIPVPAPTDGAWPTSNAAGLSLGWGMAAGTTYGGGVQGWQAGNKITIAGTTVGTATLGSFLMANVGLYLDPYNTGVAPPFEVPDYGAEIRRCQRYWYRGYGFPALTGAATSAPRGGMRHPIPMRATPAGSIRGTPKVYDGGATPTITALGTACNIYAAEFDFTCAAGGLTGGRAASMYYQTDNDYIAMDARM